MKNRSLLLAYLLLCGLYACGQKPIASQVTQKQPQDSVYTYLEAPTADGIGKVYMGREIAHVMGHLGAGWLERSDREAEERTDLLIDALALQKDEIAADIGAGTGYFTFPMSEAVPEGKVLAVDIQPEMLEMVRQRMAQEKRENIEPVLSTVQNPGLPPNGVDLVLMVDAYHEFSHPHEMMNHVVEALSPEGRVVLVEYRAEDPGVMIKAIHKMTEEQAVKEMEAVGLQLLENKKVLPQQHLMIFVKK